MDPLTHSERDKKWCKSYRERKQGEVPMARMPENSRNLQFMNLRKRPNKKG